MAEQNGSDAAAHARLRGQADAAAGRGMDAMYWYKPDAVKDAYRDGYLAVKKPPRPVRPPRPKRPTGPRPNMRRWK